MGSPIFRHAREFSTGGLKQGAKNGKAGAYDADTDFDIGPDDRHGGGP